MAEPGPLDRATDPARHAESPHRAEPHYRAELPYTVLSCSMSMDGYIGGVTGSRLLLSNAADLDRVDAVRACCDAIMVGAGTLRNDNPRLLVRNPERVAARIGRGQPATPFKVTVTATGALDARAAFFSTGGSKLVYCTTDATATARAALGEVATVVDGGRPIRMRAIGHDLFRRGVRHLMVEGGGTLHTQFLTENIADELHLVVAPIFVGDGQARRFVDDGRFPWHPARRGRLVGVTQIGDVALLRYALSERFDPARIHSGPDGPHRTERARADAGPSVLAAPGHPHGSADARWP